MGIKFRLAALAAGVLIPLGLAAPAFAATPASHTVNVTVGQEITIAGLQDVLFNNVPGTVAHGCPVLTDPNCGTAGAGGSFDGTPTESYTITSNDSGGYTLAETAGSGQFTSASNSSTIADSAWSISAANGGSPFVFSPSNSATTVFTTNRVSVATGDPYTELWTLAIPANLPAASYNNTLTYLATGN